MRNLSLFFIFAFLQVNAANAGQRVFNSGPMQATLLELYTSEGCSSCPPADRWMSKLKSDPNLWRQLIPVAFHVDYWNYLGWEDPFSNPVWSQRQRLYAANRYAKTVYTPGFFSNGREWRAWFRNRGKPDAPSGKRTGILRATLENGQLSARFTPDASVAGRETTVMKLNIAALGVGLETSVESGENDGKILKHDFVVLTLDTLSAKPVAGDYRWQHPAIEKVIRETGAKAIAFWVTRSDDPTPIQAGGGWLNQEKLSMR